MGVNKDKKLDISNGSAALKYVSEMLPYMSQNDIELTQKLIDEVNQAGYSIQFLFQLYAMDREDAKVLSPIIKKYIGMFEQNTINNALITNLGVKGNTIVTDFLLEQFRKPNDRMVDALDVSDWKGSRRWAASDALFHIQDKSRLDEYMEIVENEDTCDDSCLIIKLIGKMKNLKALRCLTRLLKSPNYQIQAWAIEALGNYGKYEDVEDLILPFLESEHDLVREKARESLRKIRKTKEEMPEKNLEDDKSVKIKSISYPTALSKIEDITNDNIDVFVELENDDKTYVLTVGTPKYYDWYMEQENTDFIPHGAPDIIVKELREDIIERAIMDFCKWDAYYLIQYATM